MPLRGDAKSAQRNGVSRVVSPRLRAAAADAGRPEPRIVAGLPVAATPAVVGAVVGGLFFKQGPPGIGVLIDMYRARLQTEQLLGAALLACLLGVAAFSLLGLLIRATTGGWHGTTAYDRPR